MRKIALCLVSSLVLISCKEGGKSGDFMDSNKDEAIGEVKSDNFVGKWKEISDENDIMEITKKYDNVYLIGSMTASKNYTNSGTAYLEGELSDGMGFQLMFDEHTQHLLLRDPFFADQYIKEFSRIE